MLHVGHGGGNSRRGFAGVFQRRSAALAMVVAVVGSLVGTGATGVVLAAQAAADTTSPLTFAPPLRVDGTNGLFGVSCPSAALCVATDIKGNVVTTTNPTGPATDWHITNVDGTNPIYRVSCPTTTLCVAVDGKGNVVTSTNPTDPASAWTVTKVDGSNLFFGVSCPTVSLCVAADLKGNVVTSTNPTEPAAPWTVRSVDPAGGGFVNVSCPSVSLCVAVDFKGNVVTSTNPTDPAAAWTVTNIDGTQKLGGVSCPTVSLCVVSDYAGNVITSINPTGPATAWKLVNVDASNKLYGVSCPTVSLCVAVDSVGNVVTSTNPTGDATAWSSVSVEGRALNSVSCASVALCVAVDGVGQVVVGTPRTATVPTVTGIAPATGPQSGGTSVTVTGTGFDPTAGATTVKFGSTPSTGTVTCTATTCTATSPAGAGPGSVDVTVTTSGGTSAVSSADQFTYLAPTVTGIAPATGPQSGGTAVTVTGTNFDLTAGATTVKFGTSPSVGAVTCTATSCTATSPAGTGTVDVTVTTSGGTSVPSSADQFTYGPTVTRIDPMAGPTAGGTVVTVTGTNLAGASAVKFGLNAATALSCTATTCTATSPAGSGTVDVTVITPDGTSVTSSVDRFAYVAVPTVTSIVPSSGPAAGSTGVTVNGTDLGGATVARFGPNAVPVSCSNATTCSITAPPGTGTVHVTITTPGGTSATTAADVFTYNPAPVVSSVSPAAGPAAGSTVVTVSGSNLSGTTAVMFGSKAATSVSCTASACTVTSPAGSGTVNVTVTTPDGTTATGMGDTFTYASPAASPTTLVVGSGCSLPDAVAEANTGSAPVGSTCSPASGSGPWIIKVPTGGATLSQVASGFNGRDGLAPIVSDVTVQSATPGTLAPITAAPASGVPAFRIFDVEPTGSLHLVNVTLSGGKAQGGNGANAGGGGAGLGGAIFSNGGTVTIADSQLTANTATGGAGGAFVAGANFGGGGGLGGAGSAAGGGGGSGSDAVSGAGGNQAYPGTPGAASGGGQVNCIATAADGTFGGGGGKCGPGSGGAGGFGGGGGGNGHDAFGGFGGGGGGGSFACCSQSAHGFGGFGGGGGGAASDGMGGHTDLGERGGYGAGNGGATGGGGGGGLGGAIFAYGGMLTINGSTLNANQVHGGAGVGGGGNGQGLGGAVFVDGLTCVYGLAGTYAGCASPGSTNALFPNASITNSTLTANTAEVAGGAVGVLDTSTVTSAGSAVPTIKLSSNTVDGNVAPTGAGLNLVCVPNSSLVGDTAATNSACTPTTPLASLADNVVAANTATAEGSDTGDIAGAVTSTGGNVVGNPTGAAGLNPSTSANPDRVGTAAVPLDVQLGALASNGGPTPTQLPALGSPVIGAGLVATCPPTDQRGLSRSGACDAGSVQVQPPLPPRPTLSAVAPTSGLAAGGTVVTITGTDLAGATVAFGTKAATSVVCVATSCTATSPPGAGIVDVTVTTAGGTSATSAIDRFSYLSSGGVFVPVAPTRVEDTRTVSGGRLAPGGSVTVTVPLTLVPSGSSAVAVNVTAVGPSGVGNLVAYPGGSAKPATSTVNFDPGQDVATAAIIPLSAQNTLTVTNNSATGSVDVIVDVDGYFTTTANPSSGAGHYYPLAPNRITDTRVGNGLPNAGHTLTPASTLTVQVTGQGGVPSSGVTAAVLNLTVTNSTATPSDYLSVYAAGATRPSVSNLNLPAGDTRANRVIVPLSGSGAVSVYNNAGTADVIVDVAGYFTDQSGSPTGGNLFTPTTPTRVLDTRISGGPLSQIPKVTTLAGQATLPPAGPSGATAAVINVTEADSANVTAGSSFLTVYPADGTPPVTSDLNYPPGDTRPNLDVATLNSQGQIAAMVGSGTANVIYDITGYFTPIPTPPPDTPTTR